MKKYLIKREDERKMTGYVMTIGGNNYNPDLTERIENGIDFKNEELTKAVAEFLTSNNCNNKAYKAVMVVEEDVK